MKGISRQDVDAKAETSNQWVSARHFLHADDPRLKNPLYNPHKNNNGRHLIESSLSASGTQWSVQGAFPTIGRVEWEQETPPPSAEKPVARAVKTTGEALFEFMERIDSKVENAFSRQDSRELKSLLLRAAQHLAQQTDDKEAALEELHGMTVKAAEAAEAAKQTKAELDELIERAKQLEIEAETATNEEVERLKAQLEGIGGGGGLRVDMLHPETGHEYLRGKVSKYVYFPSYEAFACFLACLEADGMLESVKLRRSAADDDEDATHAPKRPSHRALDGRNSIFFTLFVLRTGIDVSDASPLFGIDDSTGSRYFSSYLCFLHEWLESEFPTPTAEQIAAATPEWVKNKLPGWPLQLIFDATEFRTEFPEDLMVYRTLWSNYKHWTTVKLLGGIYPLPGGFCKNSADPTAFGGSGGDVGCTLVSRLIKILLTDHASLADKGFTLHTQFAALYHYLFIPMYAYNKQKSFSKEDSEMSHTIGHLRIYIEEAFRRVREFKIFRKQVKLSQLDLIGRMFAVCALMTNFSPLLKLDPSDPTISIAEKLWGV